MTADEARHKADLAYSLKDELARAQKKIDTMAANGYYEACVGNLSELSVRILKGKGYRIDYISRGAGTHRVSWRPVDHTPWYRNIRWIDIIGALIIFILALLFIR